MDNVGKGIMNVELLETEELLIEFEVRALTDASSKEVTMALKMALQERLRREHEYPATAPTKPHSYAYKNPQPEAERCNQRLQAFQELLLKKPRVDEMSDVERETLQTQVLHIQGRLSRLSFSQTVKNVLPGYLNRCKIILGVIGGITTKGTTLDESRERLSTLGPEVTVNEPEQLDGATEDRQPGTSRDTAPSPHDRSTPYPNSPPMLTSRRNFNSEAPLRALREEVIESLDQMRTEINRKLNQLSLRAEEDFHRPLPLVDQHDFLPPPPPRIITREDARTTETRISKEIAGWDLKFEGMRSSLHVERFFYRVERMAAKAQIPLNQLVDYLHLCLAGESREWFWVHVERNPSIGWTQLKQEMIQRFQANRTDDDIRRLLNQRKQGHPRESFLEFYDSILRIALQAKQPLSDQDLYRVLRRNMRPGLQLELHDITAFPTLSQFIKKCVALEDMWQRVGHNPEATISTQKATALQYYDKPSVRFQQTYGERQPPRVHELVEYLEENEEDEAVRFGKYQGYYEQNLCAMDYGKRSSARAYDSSHPRSAGPSQMVSMLKRPEGAARAPAASQYYACWNCGSSEHQYQYCRLPITQVFCFGCGTKGVYKPDCTYCKLRAENYPSEARRYRETRSSEQPTIPKTNLQREDSASNTDPEFHRIQKS